MNRLPAILLGVLVAAAVTQGAFWALVTPPLNGPDEEAHAAYAQYLAETGQRPSLTTGEGTVSTQLAAYSTGIGARSIVRHPEGVIDWGAGPAARKAAGGLPDSAAGDGSGANPAASYPPLYYAALAVPYRLVPGGAIEGRLLAMRLFGVVLFGVTVACTWFLAGLLLAGLWPRAFAAALVALQPKLGFMAGVINPDIMLVALSSAFLVAAALTLKRGATKWRFAAMAAAVAGASVTHPRGYYLLVPFLFTCWYAAWRAARDRAGRRASRAVEVAGIAGLGAFAAAVVAQVVRWGDGTPAGDLREFGSYLWQFYFPRIEVLQQFGPEYGYRQVFIETYFAGFGQLDVAPSLRFVDLLQVAVFVLLVLLFATVVARWEVIRRAWPETWLLASTFLSLLLLLHLVAFRYLQGTGTDPIITGRYLLCAVAIYGVTGAWVLSSLPRRAGPVVAAPLLMVSALMTIGGIGLTALRFYG